MDGNVFENMLNEAFPEGSCTRDELHDWLVKNGWYILTRCYTDVADLLSDLSDTGYDYVVSDIVIGEYEDGLAQQVAEDYLVIEDDEPSYNRKPKTARKPLVKKLATKRTATKKRK